MTILAGRIALCLLFSALGQVERVDIPARIGEARRLVLGDARTMAAKTTAWTGNADDDWENASNWTNGQPSTTGDKDTVTVLKNAVNDILTNVDRTGDNTGAGLDVALLIVEDGCTINIGTAASPLALTGDKVIINGGSEVYLKPDTGTGGLSIDRLVMDAPDTYLDVDFRDGPLIAEFLAGNVYIGSVSDANTITVYQGTSRRQIGATARVKYDATTSNEVMTWYLHRGYLETTTAHSNNSFVRLFNAGGHIVLGGSAAFPQWESFVQLAGLTEFTGDWFTFSTGATAVLMGGIFDSTRAHLTTGTAGATFRLGPDCSWVRGSNDENLITLVEIGK